MNKELKKYKEIEKFIALISITIILLLSIPYVSSLNKYADSCVTGNTQGTMFYTTLALCIVIFFIIFFKLSVSQLIKVLFNDKQTEI